MRYATKLPATLLFIATCSIAAAGKDAGKQDENRTVSKPNAAIDSRNVSAVDGRRL